MPKIRVIRTIPKTTCTPAESLDPRDAYNLLDFCARQWLRVTGDAFIEAYAGGNLKLDQSPRAKHLVWLYGMLGVDESRVSGVGYRVPEVRGQEAKAEAELAMLMQEPTELTPADFMDLLDFNSRLYLGMSGVQFYLRHATGKLILDVSTPEIKYLLWLYGKIQDGEARG